MPHGTPPLRVTITQDGEIDRLKQWITSTLVDYQLKAGLPSLPPPTPPPPLPSTPPPTLTLTLILHPHSRSPSPIPPSAPPPSP